jgi:6-methylsalicylate decarboxylase
MHIMRNLRLDVHQHVWTQPLVDALAARRELPYVRFERGLAVMYLEGERPYIIDLAAESPARRRRLLELDGLDAGLVCLSSPLGIEWLPREEASPLIDAYYDGALALGEDFGVWGALALEAPDPDDVDALLDRGCVGLSLPADAIGSGDGLAAIGAVLARLEARGAPLFVHPGPAARSVLCRSDLHALRDPLWWPALTSYVAQMQSAWLAFASAGRGEHPRLRVVFSMLAGLAPLHAERLRSRGGPSL